MLDNDPQGPLLKVLAGVLVLVLFFHFASPMSISWSVVFIILGGVAIAAYIWVVVLWTVYRKHFGPILKTQGIVTRKYTQKYDVDLVAPHMLVRAIIRALGGTGGVTVYKVWSFWIVFDVGNTELEFRLPEKLYVELEEGTPGTLTYQGEKLISFVAAETPKDTPETPKTPPALPETPTDNDLRPLG